MDLFDFWISRKDDWWHVIPRGNSGILGHLSKVQIPILGPWCLPQAKGKNKFKKGQVGSLKLSVYKSKRVYFPLSLRLKKDGRKNIEIALLC